MAKIPMNKHRGKGSREEVTYPGSPRSQKWVGNLLPVLEGYNYNHTEIIQLVKACDYNGEKIQQEVDRIMEINIGHEQGEWTVVKPQKVKNSPTAKGSKGSGNNFRREGNKVGHVPEVKTQRRPKNVKDTSPSVLVNQAVGIVTSSATVASTVVTPVETAVEMENFKNKREKKPTRDNPKDSSSKDGWKEVQKHPQQNSKKPFPMQWAALLKTKPEDTTIELPPGVTSPEAPAQPKQSKKPVEPKPVQQETKAVKPEGEHGVDAIALAKAEETLKKLEVSERIMMETQNQQKLIPTPKEQATDISPQRSQIVISPKVQQTDISPKNQQIRHSFGDVDDSPPVIMPKPLSGDIDASVMFVFFDDEPVKDAGCAPSSPTASYQQSSLNRRDKYPRGSHVHDGNPTMPRHCSSGQQHEQIDQIPGYNAQMHQENAPDVSFPGHWPMGYYGSRYSNTKHQPFSYAYEDDKHKNYRQTANEHYVPKDSRHHLNGVYVNYGYQHDRLQTPPGLVGFYTPQQPFYGFPNSSGQANPHGPSDSMTSSMWRT